LCDLTREDRPARGLVRLWRPRIHALEDFDRLLRKVMERDDMHELAIKQMHGAHMRMAEAHSVGDNRFKDRLQIEGGAANGFEHFSGSSLLLLRLITLAAKLRELTIRAGSRGAAAA